MPESYQYDLIVIGGGPAGYAAAIRAAQLGKRVLCLEKENLGGTCLNWGCIPTKSLLEDGAFVRKVRAEAQERGLAVENLQVDFPGIIARSRQLAERLSKGIAHLFRKYKVTCEMAAGQVLGPHRVRASGRSGTRELTADHLIVATGAKPVELPGIGFDGQQIIGYRQAMTLKQQPARLAIIGGGAIGCEFADFYNSLGSEVTIVEMLPHLLPNEDEEVCLLLERLFARRGIRVFTQARVNNVEKGDRGLVLNLAGDQPRSIQADMLLVAAGVTGNVQGLAAAEAGLRIEHGRIVVDPEYRTSLPNVWAVGDCIRIAWPADSQLAGTRHPDLAHVAHHEAVCCVHRIFGVGDNRIDYRFIPACTYTHPQVASLGLTEKQCRDQKRSIRTGKFPFSASGRALAAGQPDGFVKLIFDASYGELLGAHMIGENVTELLAELVLARKLEATEAEIVESMHPHPTMSEAIMEAAGVSANRSIHL